MKVLDSRVVSANTFEADDLVLRVHLRLELLRGQPEASGVVAPRRATRDRAFVRLAGRRTWALLLRRPSGHLDELRTAPARSPRRSPGRAGRARRRWSRRALRPHRPCRKLAGAKSDRSSERFATFEELIALLRIFAFVTAPFASCGVPTVFRPSCVDSGNARPAEGDEERQTGNTIAGDGRPRAFSCRVLSRDRRARLPLVSAGACPGEGSLTFLVHRRESTRSTRLLVARFAIDVALEPLDETSRLRSRISGRGRDGR